MDYHTQLKTPSSLERLKLRFAFDGRIGDLLRQCFYKDAENWRLSTSFRLYYQIRRWIPLMLRQRMQQSRNRTLPVGDDWYRQPDFLDRWALALKEDLQSGPTPLIHPWPDGYSHSAIVTHDIETLEGVSRVERLASLEEKLGIRSAWYFVPAKYKIDSGLLDDLRARGHEVGVHGYNHDGQLFSSKRLFQQRTIKINAIARAWQATGFRAPMMHRQLSWMQSLEFNYDASCFDIDPFQAMPGGVGGVWPFIVGSLVELPCTLPQDHTLFVTLQQQSTDVWRDKLELIRKLRGMAMCIVHPDYLSTPKNWDLHRELLELMLSADDAWHCLPHQAAIWWRQRDQSQVVSTAIEGPAMPRGRIVSLAELF
ncbi:MAG: hypothetical protein ABI557_03690 [Aureliella sp.]